MKSKEGNPFTFGLPSFQLWLRLESIFIKSVLCESTRIKKVSNPAFLYLRKHLQGEVFSFFRWSCQLKNLLLNFSWRVYQIRIVCLLDKDSKSGSHIQITHTAYPQKSKKNRMSTMEHINIYHNYNYHFNNYSLFTSNKKI